MEYIFSRKGIAALDRLHPNETLVALDFDGTLAPIEQMAGRARMDVRMRRWVSRLSEGVPVVIISGRSVSDLRSRLEFEPRYTIGNHGLEAPWSKTAARRAARLVERWREQLDWSVFAGDPGTYLEDKHFSLSLHYRMSKHPAVAARKLRAMIERLSPRPRVVGGKFIFSLTPKGAPDKGTALLRAWRNSRRPQAVFVGDDETDEDIFRLARPRLLTIRVGRKRGSAASFYLRDQREVAVLMRALLKRFSTAPHARGTASDQAIPD